MPIYEYKCNDCETINEFMVGVIAEKEEIKCKSCSSKNLEKIFSAFSVSKNQKESNSSCQGCPSTGSTCPYRG